MLDGPDGILEQTDVFKTLNIFPMILKKRYGTLLCLCLLHSVSAQSIDSSHYTYYYELAQERYGQNDMPAAMQAIDKAIRMAPKAYELYLIRGVFYHVQRDFSKAIADYDHCITLSPYEPTPYYNRGLSWSEINDPYAACDDFEEAYKLTKALGEEAFLKEIDASMSVLCSTKNPVYFVQRCAYHYDKEMYVEAARICDEGLAAFPDYPALHIYKGHLLQKMQAYRSAIASYRKGIDLYYQASAEDKKAMTQNIVYAYRCLAECLYILDDFKGALRDQGHGIKRGEWPAEILYLERGNTYLVMGEYTKAMDDYNRGLELNPRNGELLTQRALCRMLEPGCVLLSRKAVLPQDCAHYWECFEFQFDRSKAGYKNVIEAALKDCDEALAIIPDNGNSYFIRGIIRELDGSDGCDDMRRARELHCAVDPVFLDKCP